MRKTNCEQASRTSIPAFLRRRLGEASAQPTHELLKRYDLQTVCSEARCPNREECFGSRTATFLILGRVCTRNCRFCSVETGSPLPPDIDEPGRLAKAAQELGLHHVVVTSVTRDDLADGGAGHFAATIRALKAQSPTVTVEVLTPDFEGREEDVRIVSEAGPDVFNHNLETVRRLSPLVRSKAEYERSLAVLGFVARTFPDIQTKSGLMVGLGESEKEVFEALRDLREAGVRALTIGQYLRPSSSAMAVAEFIRPETFSVYEAEARRLGFEAVAAGPFVRSSYRAGELFQKGLGRDINSRYTNIPAGR